MAKNRYIVYQVDELHYGDGRVDTNKTQLAHTSAMSEKQAVNNVRWSLQIKPENLYCPYRDGGYRQSKLVAEVAHTSR